MVSAAPSFEHGELPPKVCEALEASAEIFPGEEIARLEAALQGEGHYYRYNRTYINATGETKTLSCVDYFPGEEAPIDTDDGIFKKSDFSRVEDDKLRERLAYFQGLSSNQQA